MGRPFSSDVVRGDEFDMEGNFLEYVKIINQFMQHYCANTQTRRSIIDHFDVTVHVYEVYAPGQKVYGWANMGKLISDDGIMFRVENRRTGLVLYPVFRPDMAKDMIRYWQLPMPHKWSVYAPPKNQVYQPISPLNQEFLNMLAYARLFVSLQSRLLEPLPYAFEETFNQLHSFPQEVFDGQAIVRINKVIRQYLLMNTTVINCKHLQEFIAYLHNRYPMLNFVNSDFQLLRELLAHEAPGMPCFF